MEPRLIARILCLSALIGASMVVAPTSTLAVSVPTFEVNIGNCWRGRVPDAFAHVHVVWKDVLGRVVDQFNVQSHELGYWNVPGRDTTCATRPVRGGDRLTQTETDKGGYSRSYIVQGLDGRFDRKTNLVTGHAPTSSMMYLGVVEEDLIGHYGSPLCSSVKVPRAADRSFSYDTATCHPGYNATGGDQAWITWYSARGDTEQLVMTAPYAQLKFGTAQVSGYGFAGTPVSATLKTETGSIRATGKDKSDVSGAWVLNLKNKAGSTVRPRVGDVISGNWATGGTSFKVFGMTTGFGSNTVHGTCTPTTRYSLIVLWPGTTYGSRTNGVTNGIGSTGNYTPSGHALASGDTVLFTCARLNGDRERRVTVYP